MIDAMIRKHFHFGIGSLTPNQVNMYMRRIPLLNQSSEASQSQARAEIRREGRYG